jgi:hypothetical protein
VWCCNSLNVEADLIIQLSSIKANIKEICKNVKQCYSFNNYFCFGKYSLYQSILIMLTFSGFYFLLFLKKVSSKYLKFLSQF